MRQPVKKTAERGMRLQRRSFDLSPTTANDEQMSIDLLITSQNMVRTFVPDPSFRGPALECPYIEADEVLLASGLDYSRTLRMPLIDGHDTSRGVDGVLGRVDNVRAEGDLIVGTAFIRPGKADIWPDLKGGFLGQVSAGFCVDEYVLVERTDGVDVPLVHATKWTLLEASLVPIGADAAASVRSQKPLKKPTFKRAATKREDKTMKFSRKRADDQQVTDDGTTTADTSDLAALVDAATDAISAVIDASDDGADDDTIARANALRKFRADTETEDQPNDGADGNPDTAATPEEAAAVEEARSLARAYGKDKVKLVDDLCKLGARASEIKKALRSAISAGAGKVDTTPVKAVERQRAAEPTINTRSIYATINGRGRK